MADLAATFDPLATGSTWQRRRSLAVVYGLLSLFAAYYILPLGVIVLNSFRDMTEISRAGLIGLPHSFSLDHWAKAWGSFCINGACKGIAPFFYNSLWMAIPATIISTAIGAINGYVLSQWRFRGSETLFTFMTLGVFLPGQMVLLPWAWTLGTLGLSNTIAGLVLIHCVQGISFTTLFCRNYYVSIPDALIKAARIDGAGFWRIFRKIVLPLSPPILIVTVIWQFTGIWNDFLFGIIFAGRSNWPMTVQLNNIVQTTTGTRLYDVNMAATILTAAVPLIVYFISGRWFVRGIAAGAVKG
jgi:glucose/mannose transport system permease protein